MDQIGNVDRNEITKKVYGQNLINDWEWKAYFIHKTWKEIKVSGFQFIQIQICKLCNSLIDQPLSKVLKVHHEKK